MSRNKPQKGFTLIELLVVVAIISLLSSVVLGALNDARAKARDRALVQQVKQIQNALELYRGKYGEYPDDTAAIDSDNAYSNIYSTGVISGSDTANWTLASKLLEFLPKIDPPYTGSINYYKHISGKCTGDTTVPYILTFKPETSAFNSFPTVTWAGVEQVNVGSPTFNNHRCLSVN